MERALILPGITSSRPETQNGHSQIQSEAFQGEIEIPQRFHYQGEMWDITGPVEPKVNQTEPYRMIVSVYEDDGKRLMAVKPESWIRDQVRLNGSTQK